MPRPVGVLVVDEKGQIKEHRLGQRSGKAGAGIGLVLAVIAPPTLLAGMVGGGIIGHFHHKGLGLTDEDRERIAAELAGGKAAIGVLVEEDLEAGDDLPPAHRSRRYRRDPRGDRGGARGRRGGRAGGISGPHPSCGRPCRP